MLLVQVPAARAHLQRGDGVVELVALAVLLQRERAANRSLQVDLALNLVVPLRAVAVLKVGHVAVGTAVEGVDHHLRVYRAGDLHAAALKRLGQRRNLPVARSDVRGLSQKIRPLAGIEPLGALHPRLEQCLTARLKRAVQLGHQRQRIWRQNFCELCAHRRVDFHPLGHCDTHG
jgi:hypothetical protein